jgi:ATP phosphoribosyltransferase regulatory subunit
MINEAKLPQRAKKIRRATAEIEKILEGYGYTEVYLPLYEYYDILSKTAWDFSDENIIRFIDRNTGKSMVLRPDFTPQVCRNVANYFNSYPRPIRLSYKGRIFRNVNTNKGLKSEMQQIGLELFGEEELFGDLELINIGYKCLLALGIQEFKIVFTDIFFLKEVLNLIDNNENYLNLIETKNYSEIEKFLNSAGISTDRHELFSTFAKCYGGFEILSDIREKVSFSKELQSRIDELASLHNNLVELGVSSDKIVFDLSETSGINYYTGINVKFIGQKGNILASGGRYDNIMRNFGINISACGLAFNLEEILTVYGFNETKVEVDYLVIGKDNFKKAEELRKKGFKVLWVSDKDKLQKPEIVYDIKNILS